MKRTVLVLGGGPDAEREVSLISSRCVYTALISSTAWTPSLHIFDRISQSDLAALPGDVVFPVLHGPFGEGGPMQDLLERDGRPFVGCTASAARMCMDKVAAKLAASDCGVLTAPAAVLNLADPGCPFPFPVVVKPVHEGSSIGVHFARDQSTWAAAVESVRADRVLHPTREYMVERAILGARELTVGLLDGRALAPIEILPKETFYDYHAKYTSNDTRYQPAPELPAGVDQQLRTAAERVFAQLGCRHLSRADFLLEPPQAGGRAWFLEINSMPGFTDHSLLPMAVQHAGRSFASLCTDLIEMALRDA
jgi:D-alanine-D-alanine ligase